MSVNALQKLINDILDFSKMEAGKLSIENIDIDLFNLVKDVVKTHSISASEKKLQLELNFSEGIPRHLNGDPLRIKQVLDNLIGNAIKFTEQGSVQLSVRKGTKFKDKIEIVFVVTDTGIGIAPDAVGQVFDRFVKLNTFSKGTGLGLSICRSIVEHLGGTIGAESEVGVGSRFWFTHPCAESA